MKSGKKVFGIGDATYKTSGQGDRGVSVAVRKKVNAKKLKIIRSWKRNLTLTLRLGVGLDIHLDTAMRELIENLEKCTEEITR